MKIIHTSDWHIGKIVNEFSMLEDQKYILNELLKLVDKEKPNVLVIAGDIYDRSIPPVEGVELLNNILSELIIKKGIKVLAISGNHDSGERVGFANSILEKQGLYIIGRDEELYRKIALNDECGIVNFYLVPYKDPSVVRKLLDNNEIKNHNDAMKAIIENINLNKNERNILITHGYITMYREKAKEADKNKYQAANLEISESERPLSIGGTDLIDCNIFNDFDYVALGHLHGRQRVGREEVRYSGSLLKYSFSEVNQKKGVTVFEIDKDKNVTVNLEELTPLRDLRVIKGNIDEIIENGRNSIEGKDDYIQAILLDKGELINPIETLRAVYPNTMLITRENKRQYDGNNTSAKSGYKNKSEKDLFEEFYNSLSDGEFTEDKSKVIDEIINEVLKGEI